MRNKYELIAENASLSSKYSVNKNGTETLPPTTKEEAEKYIKFNKQKDREFTILNKDFTINSIWREDLVEYTGKEKALKLSNQDMKQIARLMHDCMQEEYWECLKVTLYKLDIKLLENHEE
jgi:dsDNA-binding SOS-regulon protein